MFIDKLIKWFCPDWDNAVAGGGPEFLMKAEAMKADAKYRVLRGIVVSGSDAIEPKTNLSEGRVIKAKEIDKILEGADGSKGLVIYDDLKRDS